VNAQIELAADFWPLACQAAIVVGGNVIRLDEAIVY
jgi:hypothetical protein